MSTKTIISLILIFTIPLISANIFSSKDITFSVNQKDYYFKTGENAIIPLEIENSYGKEIKGILTNTYTQKINQGGMYFSTSNSQSTSFVVPNQKSTKYLNFGTSNNPSTLEINLKFNYFEKENRIINLNGLKIHFVSNENQKQNKENKLTVSSQQSTNTQQSSNLKDPFSEIQKQMNQLFKKQQTKSTQQRLQNSQMKQDSSALKKQIERQFQEEQELKKRFQKKLAQNTQLQKEHQKMLQKGYNLKSNNLNPSSENSGDFNLKYQKPNGETAEISGKMENGEIKEIQSLTQEDKKKIIQQLKKNKEFQKLENELTREGFQKEGEEFNLKSNETKIKINYKNKNNQTAQITADIINNTIKNIKIKKDNQNQKSNNYFTFLKILLIIILITISYIIYKKHLKKKKILKEKSKNKTINEKSYDYKTEAKKLLKQAKKYFKEERYKDAYEKVGQALRLFLSYKYDLKREITNDEIINYLKGKKEKTEQIKECFNLCSLVEFAKFKPKKEEFKKITKVTEEILNN